MAYLNDDTICALATASGGAMAIIRVSGTQAISIADALFVSPTGIDLLTPAATPPITALSVKAMARSSTTWWSR